MYEAIKSEVNKKELSHRHTQHLKLLFPITALSLDELLVDLPAANLVILRTRAAFDRSGALNSL